MPWDLFQNDISWTSLSQFCLKAKKICFLTFGHQNAISCRLAQDAPLMIFFQFHWNWSCYFFCNLAKRQTTTKTITSSNCAGRIISVETLLCKIPPTLTSAFITDPRASSSSGRADNGSHVANFVTAAPTIIAFEKVNLSILTSQNAFDGCKLTANEAVKVDKLISLESVSWHLFCTSSHTERDIR